MAESREPLVLQVPAEAVERERSKVPSESEATNLPEETSGNNFFISIILSNFCLPSFLGIFFFS